ncbi:hypothetical protein DIPPA_27088 [Diplonema papillatum]|nr:hypothetical protein DIPPA_27088 [Diplonema papillatum]
MQAGGLRLAAARCLGGFVQARFSSKITTGGMKGKIQRGGRGGPVSKKYGWKEMPGAIVCTGDTIYKTQIESIRVDWTRTWRCKGHLPILSGSHSS